MNDNKPTVQQYYDNNTRRFLRFGQNKQTRNIHQPLWAEGVHGLAQAVDWSNGLVLNELNHVRSLPLSGPPNVLDLGCGVGSSLFYLAENAEDLGSLIGISNSQVQVDLAQRFARSEVGGERCRFLLGDFLALPALPVIHLAFAIEAFLHAEDAAKFFRVISTKLELGGRLVLIDDFLTEQGRGRVSSTKQGWLNDFRAGWLAESLISEVQAHELAAGSGLQLVESENLTPLMRLGRPRDRLIGLMRTVAGSHMRRSTYLRALNGGYAKQQCLKHSLVEYRRVVWERVR